MTLLIDTWHYLTDTSNWSGSRGFGHLIFEHLRLSVAATIVAFVIAVPLGVFFGHRRRGGVVASSIVNIGRALPTFAIIVLAFSVFSSWRKGLTIWPTLVALVLLAIPPMFTNTYTAIRNFDDGITESALAMGMTSRSVLWLVELPVATPLILTGIRISTVQVIATATLGAWVGFSCIGTLLFEGFAQQNNVKILTGAVLVAALTIATEIAFSILQRLMTPWSRSGRSRSGRRHAGRSRSGTGRKPQLPLSVDSNQLVTTSEQ